MNCIKIQLTKQPMRYLRILYNVLNLQPVVNDNYLNTFVLDGLSNELQRYPESKIKNDKNLSLNFRIQHIVGNGNKTRDISVLSEQELDEFLLKLITKNKDKEIEKIVMECHNTRKFISEGTLKQMFRHYSIYGKPEMIMILQKYCGRVDPNLQRRNGQFLHYLAKAHCMKGNSEKGLLILKQCYKKYENRKNYYRIIFRELIQDSVLNRSEASLVIFKKYALEFSEQWGEHYPLLCFWYICWSSSWFSDQMLSDELLETSKPLQDILKDKATAFSITVLREDYNEDAVMRLLQSLLKYNMMSEYSKVLQVLFNYKLKIRDIRGCTEILRNCEALDISLPSDQQGRYLRMLIEGKQPEDKPTQKTMSKDFKLKF